METRYTVELFGGFAIHSKDGVVGTRFRSRQTASLLAYLVYYPEKAHSREVLADMFWPSASTSENARLSLSVALSTLRSQLEKPPVPPDSLFKVTSATLGLQPGAITTDVQRFERLLAEEKWEEAVAAYTGPLLPGFYDEWVTSEQARLRDRFHFTVVQLRRRCEERNDIEGALRWQRLTVEGDPTDRDAVSSLLTALCNAGRYEEAARTFYEVERRLRDEYDEPISPRIRAENADLLARYAALNPKRPRGRPRLGGGPGNPPGGGSGREPSGWRGPGSGEDAGFSPDGERAILVPDRLSTPRTPDPGPRTPTHILPLQLRRIIGRDAEIAEIEARLQVESQDRLLTLTGMTGIGKTQLAIALAHRFQAQGRRVLFIPLLTLRREDQLLSDLAEAVGAPGTTADALISATVRELEREPTLLVLDNFEHLINTKAAQLVGQLLARAPSLKCLVTSQRRLPIPGEAAFPVHPLHTPPDTAGLWAGANSEELLTRYPAMALFQERAQNVMPDFRLTSENGQAVGDLVRALNGVPLAIELAAARINILEPVEIKAALTERITLLASSRVDPEDRHHSLQASLQWSYDLLPSPVQQLFRRISVFRGGFAAADVAEVTDEQLAFDYLALLSDASLLHSSYTPSGVRLSLLDIVRLFAEEQMNNAEKASARHRHANLFVRKCEQARTKWRTLEESVWLSRLAADQGNLTATCHWLLAQHAASLLEQGYRMGRALSHYWATRGQREEGIAFFQALLQKPVTDPAAPYRIAVPVDLRVSVLNALGTLFIHQVRYSDADTWLREAHETVEEAVQIAAPPEKPALERQRTGVQVNLALVAQKKGDMDRAGALLESALEYYRRVGDKRGIGITLSNLGSVALDAGDLESSLDYLHEGRAISEECGDQFTVGYTYGNEGEVCLRSGDLSGAEAAWRAALEIHHALHANDHISLMLLRLTVVLERQAKTPLIGPARAASCVYRRVAGLPLDDFKRPPYNLVLPNPNTPLPTHTTAEARLLEAVENILHPPHSTNNGSSAIPFGDPTAPVTGLYAVSG